MKNPAEELTVHILFASVVGYFADAQYDEKRKAGYFACAQYDEKGKNGIFRCAQYDVRERRQQELRFNLIA